MKTLHLGVLVQPYTNGRKGMTTADVAHILESNYGVMAAFYKVHQQDIASAVTKSLEGALETLMLGGPAGDPFGAGMQDIYTAFNTFISSREAERVGIPGTPTWAALCGVNHRLVHPYAKGNPRRPSFRDTGLYQTSFRSWIT